MRNKLIILLLFVALSHAKTYFTIQLMSVKERNSIPISLIKSLQKSNIDYKIIKVNSLYKLISGKYKRRKDANIALASLKKFKSDAFITREISTRNQKDKSYIAPKTIQIMATNKRESIANSALRMIKKSGISYRIVHKNDKFYLLAGEFNSKVKLDNALKVLRKKFGDNIFARNILGKVATKEAQAIRPEYMEFLQRKNLYAGVVLASMQTNSNNNIKLDSSLGAGFQFGLKLPYNLRVQSQYIYYPQVREVRQNSDKTNSYANRTYHQLNLSLKKEIKIAKNLTLLPKAGLSISTYNIDNKDANYLLYQHLYDTRAQSEILFNPHLGIGLNYQLDNSFNFDMEYLRTFELNIDQILINLNYQY